MRLYQALFAALAERRYCDAYAGIKQPSEPGVALQRSVGFRDIGRLPSVGWEFGTRHEVSWFHRHLRSWPQRRATFRSCARTNTFFASTLS